MDGRGSWSGVIPSGVVCCSPPLLSRCTVLTLMNRPEESEPQNESNPYTPPPASSLLGAEAYASRGFVEYLDISLVGRPTLKDLQVYLKSEGYVSLFSLIVAAVGCFLLLVLSSLWGYPAIAITVGFCGFIVLTMSVSTMPYRISLFKNLYPTWDLMDSVELCSTGVTVCHQGTSVSYDWDWFGRAVVAGKVIALIPAIQPAKPVLIGQSMLQGEVGKRTSDWDALVDFSRTEVGLKRKSGSNKVDKLEYADMARRNQELQCRHDRERTVAAVPGSWLFCGRVTTEDLSRIPRASQRLQKTHRSKVVAWLLVVIVAVFCAGVSELAFGAFWILSGLYLLYVLAWGVKSGRRNLNEDVREICYLMGYGTTDYVCLDGGIVVSRIPWSDLRVLANDDAFLAMQTGTSGQYVIVREDMFETPEHWAEFQRVAQSKGA